MKPTIQQNLSKSLLFCLISYLISIIKCCDLGQVLDFDGICRGQCTGTTSSENCESSDCSQMLQISCITCLDQYYKQNNTCILCNSQYNCNTCIDDSTCLSCTNNLYLQSGSCVAVCGNGYYQNTSKKQCQQCNPSKNCYTCIDNVSTCSSCNSNLFLDVDSCVSDCPEGKHKKLGLCVISCGSGYYLNLDNECKSCNSNLNCEQCNNDGSSCIKCNQQSQYQYKLNEKCVDDCGAGYYLDSNDNNTCKQCSEGLNCSQCTNSTSCTKCISNFYLKNSSQCVQDCGIGLYTDLSTQTCKQCNSSKNCETCQNNNSCLTCIQSSSNKYLMPDGCVQECGNGYYNSLPSNVCLKCDVDKNCKTCSSNGKVCDTCDQTSSFKYMKNNICLSNCGDYFYNDDNTYNCQPCNSTMNCKTCSNPYTCDTCQDNKYQKSGYCVDDCGEGYFSNDYKECQRCQKNLNCKTCSEENACLTCDTDSNFPFFQDNKCVTSCPPGFFNDNNICKQCLKDLNCLACNNQGQTCISCITDQQNITYKYLINGKCDIQCGDGYYTDPGQFICKSCVSGGHCKSCTNSTSCQTCDIGSQYMFMKNQLCVKDCGDGFYGDNVNYQCSLCNSSLNCLTCSDNSSCLTCDQNSQLKYKKNGQCVQSCGERYYYDASNNCQPCEDPNCLLCKSAGQCSECDQSTSFKYLRQNSCETSCGDQFYPSNNNVCQSCDPSMYCKTCNDLSSCTSCYTNQNNAYLKDGKCQSACSLSQYPDDNKVCIDCNPDLTCATCSSIGCETCDKQSQFPYLQTNRCVSTCSEGFYLDQTKQFCTICNSYLNCKTCTQDGGKCQSCSSASPYRYLQDGICVSVCSDSYFPDSINNLCSQCNSQLFCKSCNNSNSCTSCDQSGLYKYLNGGICVTQCDFGQFPENYQCQKCQSNCRTCIISSECTSCEDNQYLKESQCVDDCGDGYQIVNNKVCQPCQGDKFCKTCSQSTAMCDSCYQEANTYTGNQLRQYLFNGSCIDSCSSVGFPNEKNQCISCPQNCISCTKPNFCDVCQQLAQRNEDGSCILCNPGELITEVGKQCISHVLCSKNPQYVVNKENNMCITKQSCLNKSTVNYIQVIGNYSQCGICFSPYFISSDRTQCMKQCPPGEIQNDINSILCTRCEPPLIANLEKSLCIEPSQCTSPNIISLDDLQCIPKQSCLTQDNTYIYKDNDTQTEYCKICLESVISNNKMECLGSCPSQQYQNFGKKTCQKCSNSNQKQCSCSNFIDRNDNCVDQCPQMYYIDPNFSTKQCTFCSDLLTYDLKQCVKTCPIGYYLNSPISFICIPCNSYVTQNGYSCVQQCTKITDIDNKRCIQEQTYCPSLLSVNGNICSKFCINGEVEIQNQQQCASKCPQNFIRDIRNGSNTCIPATLCIGTKSSDQEKCILKCSDVFEVQSETSDCVKICPSDQIKVITNDLQIQCIMNNEDQYLNNINNLLQNFIKILQNQQLITDEYKNVYLNELQQYINKMDDFIKMEQLILSGWKISQNIFSSIQKIMQLITYQSYNSVANQFTFTSNNFKITSQKLKLDETFNSDINFKQFLSLAQPILIQKIADQSKIQDKIPSLTIAYIKQNIFCQEQCSDKYGYFSVKQNIPLITNQKINRVLENSNLTLNTTKIIFELDKDDNIDSLTCVSLIDNIQQQSISTSKDKQNNSITCTFLDNVYLINDSNCKYQTPVNCKNNYEEAKQEDKNEEDSNLSSNQVIGIVIGIFITFIAMAILGYMVYKRRIKKQKQTKYIDSNNVSKINDLEQLQQQNNDKK